MIDTALLGARILLAVVLAVAALTKLADRTGSVDAVENFGLPRALAGPVGFLLPLVELAAAGALLAGATAWWGAVGAVLLLLAFTVAIASNLVRGRRPDCHCFGNLHSAPVGWMTVVRNGLLAATAGFVVWQGRVDAGPGAWVWLTGLTALQLASLSGAIVFGGGAALGALLLVNLMRQNGRLLVRMDALEARLEGTDQEDLDEVPHAQPGLEMGSPAPDFSLPGLHGETLTLHSLRASGLPVMLLFSDPKCGPCNTLMPEVTRWQQEHSGKLRVAFVNYGSVEDNRAKATEHGLVDVLLQPDGKVADSYLVGGTPSAVLVNGDGTIGSSPAAGADAIRALLARTVGSPAPLPMAVPPPQNGSNGATASIGLGDPAPSVELPDLTGKKIKLARFRGSETVLVFWNPGCGFCQQMLDDLKAWEATRPKSAPKIVVVSSGTAETNRAMGLRSPILLDEGFAVAGSFGASGTPMAVLLDVGGHVASEVAAGARGVLELAKGRHHDIDAAAG